jgi:RsiW-degrading membrane proteinase PrsW (M82 family)
MDPASFLYTLGIVFAPLTEEPSKALAMLIAAYVLWKVIPNRRYGASLGAAAGLGFGIAESILYIYQIAVSNLPEIAAVRGEAIAIRVIVTPFMHPLWSAFVGIGVFALVSSRFRATDSPRSAWWIPSLFLLMGIVNHLIWNGVSFGLSPFGYSPIILNLLVTFPIFAVVLRDFLGGHYNVQDFFEPLAEPSAAYPAVPPPPPAPPQV